MNSIQRSLRATIILVFITIVFVALIYSRIVAYSLAPTMKPAHFEGLLWWEIPIAYLIDYFSHGTICLLFAFVTAGLIQEFTPKTFITKHMGSSKVSGYIIASLFAPFLTVCSCTMVPLFAGIFYAGSGIGPAMTFLLMAPAANILTILLTGEIISWEIAITRIIASIITALAVGIVVAKTPWGKKVEADNKLTDGGKTVASVDIVHPPLDERLWAALKFGGYLGKQILPWFILGLMAVSYLEAYLPEEIVATYLTGVLGVFLASVIGGPLYTPTLVEIALGRGLMDLGMSRAAMLSWLMGQPYDIPNMVATSRIVHWKVVITYALIALIFSVLSGLVYGFLIGEL